MKRPIVGWFKNPISSQTEKLMAATKFSDYLGLNHYKKAKKLKHFIHLRLAHQVHTVHTVKLAVSLKWQVLFENDMKITPIFTIIFISKMLTLDPSHN